MWGNRLQQSGCDISGRSCPIMRPPATWSSHGAVDKTRFIMSNAILSIAESIHQGYKQFSAISRGKQSSFISLAALLCAQSNKQGRFMYHSSVSTY